MKGHGLGASWGRNKVGITSDIRDIKDQSVSFHFHTPREEQPSEEETINQIK